MKRRLVLSRALPLNVWLRVCANEALGESFHEIRDLDDESFREMHVLIMEQISRRETFKVQAIVGRPSKLWQWIPSSLPNLVTLSLRVEVLDYVTQDEMDSQGQFISASNLTFCYPDSPVTFPFTCCPLLQIFHTTGIGLSGLIDSSPSSIWRKLIVFLAEKCPRLEALHVISINIQSPAHDVFQGDWPVLPSLTTLDIAHGPSSSDIRCILGELKAPRLRRVGFRGHLSIYGSLTEVRFPGENDGRVLLSNMPPTTAIELLLWIANAEDLRVELDLDSIIDGHPGLRNAGT
ncbi:hypothetical protein FRC00_005152 [Tulasnella sp. 408]|nr:hypothetical protein FRC00_005152 [Tulasnella sp. 408]